MAGGTGKCEYNYQVPGCGIAYKLSPSADGKWTETVIYNFVRGGGFAVTPSGELILDNAGQLLGTSIAGGDGLGTVFVLRQSQKGWEQEVLYRFYGDPDGGLPVGKVVINPAGVLIGATKGYGKGPGSGSVFVLERSGKAWRERVIHSFAAGSDGSYPEAGLVSDSHGHLFGTTANGGRGCTSEGCGTVYEITP
jgi:uncharacterized repeat protein (TIGR03803 family)